MNGPCEYCEMKPWTIEHGYGRTHIQICAECNVDYLREKEREDSEPERLRLGSFRIDYAQSKSRPRGA